MCGSPSTLLGLQRRLTYIPAWLGVSGGMPGTKQCFSHCMVRGASPLLLLMLVTLLLLLLLLQHTTLNQCCLPASFHSSQIALKISLTGRMN